MKDLLTILFFFFYFYNNSYCQSDNNNKISYIYNLVIDCKSNLYDDDYKIIVCNSNEELYRINEISNLKDKNLYYIKYYYNQNQNRIPKDTLRFDLKNKEIDSIYYLVKNVFYFKDLPISYLNKQFVSINMYDGIKTEIIFDNYHYHIIYRKEDDNYNVEIKKLLNYIALIKRILIPY